MEEVIEILALLSQHEKLKALNVGHEEQPREAKPPLFKVVFNSLLDQI